MKKLSLVLVALMMVATFAIAQTTIFSDNMTNFPTGWTLSPTSGGWTKTSTKYYSSSYSAMGDNISPYGSSQANYMTRSVNLSGYTSATLKFYIWQYTESGYDYVYLQYYNGSTWTNAWSRAGSYQSWAQQSVTIPTTATQIRFYFKSDGSVQNTGAYIDDVVLTATGGGTVTQNDAGTGGDAGNTLALATAVSPGSWTGCYLDGTDREDYYKFSVTSGQVIKVKVTPPSSADYDVYLYNPSQTQVASSTLGSGLVDSVVYTATVTGTFYARAYEYSGTGNYSLQISVSGGATPTLAVSSTSWSPAAAGGTSSAVNVTNSGTSSVIAYTVSDNATWLTTSATSGNTPGSFTMTASANTGAARSATVTVTATTGGVSGSPKTISVSQAAASAGDTYEPNGTFAEAYGPLTSGTTYNSYIYSSTDIDYYKLNVTTTGMISATLKNLPGDYDLYLYNSAQTQVAYSNNGSTTAETLSYNATAAGTYYLKVIGYNSVYSTTVAYAVRSVYPTGTPIPTLAVSQTSWAPVAAGGSALINVTNSGSTSVIAYTVSSNQSWLTVSAASGNTPGSFTMTAAANTGTSARTATVTVTATTGGVAGSPKTITVNQPAPGSSGYEWTIMVYLNGDNNLEQFGFTNFNQMAAASYSSGKYRVIVQFDRHTGYDATNGNWTTCKRFNVTAGMTATAANQISDIGEVDMGSPTTLSTFANWAIDNYPANKYFLVFWNHGAGWTKDAKGEAIRDFSNDEQSGQGIGIANGEFATAMSTITSHLGRKLDIIGWDCCLMGMQEVFDIARNYADAAVASEETEAGTGWNYTPFLNAINNNPTISALDLGKAQIQGTGSGLDTQADIDLTKIANVNTKVSTFADQLMAAKVAGYTSVINSAQSATQAFYYSEYRDLYDFASRINAAAVPAALKTAATDVMTAVNAAVYFNYVTSSYSGAHGISIYNPLANGSSYNTSYNSLPFATNTHWDEYIKGQTSASSTTNPTGNIANLRMSQNKELTFELGGCWPSPVVKTTDVYYSLVAPGQTTLKLYNLSGQLVRTLVAEHQNAGRYTVHFNGMDNAGKRLPAGAYVYRLTSGSSSDTKRMILVK